MPVPSDTIPFNDAHVTQIYSIAGEYFLGVQNGSSIANMVFIKIEDFFKVREHIQFSTASPSAFTTKGTLKWNTTDDNLEFYLTNGVIVKLGESFVPFKATENIAKGQLVMHDLTVGTQMVEGSLAVSDGTISSHRILGVAAEAVTTGNWGRAIKSGKISGLNTSAWTVGDLLYSNPASPGDYVTTLPTAPSLKAVIGEVLVKDVAAGIILVKQSDGFTLDLLDNVNISGVADGEIMAYDAATGTWLNSTTLSKATKIKDTTGDHTYDLAVSELSSNRIITLPLLTGPDEFVFKDHIQTLTNKTLTSPKLNEDVVLSATATQLNAVTANVATNVSNISENTQLIASKDQANLNAHNSITKRLAITEAETLNSAVENTEPTNKTGVATDGTVIGAVDGSIAVETEGRSWENEYPDSSFESGIAGWTEIITGSGLSNATDQFLFGAKSLKLTQGGSASRKAEKDYTLDTSKYYYISIYGRSDGAFPKIRLIANTFEASSVDSTPVESDSKWTRLGIKVNPTTADGKLWLYAESDGATIGATWYDGIQINEITATEYNDLTTDELAAKYPYHIGLRSSLPHDVESVGVNQINPIANGMYTGADALQNTAEAKAVALKYDMYKGMSVDGYFRSGNVNSVYVSDTVNNSFTFNIANNSYGPGIKFRVKPSTTYKISTGSGAVLGHGYYGADGSYLSSAYTTDISTPANCMYVIITLDGTIDTDVTVTQLQAEYGASATTYQAYKSNHAHCPVTLNAVPTAQDTYNFKTGVNGVNVKLRTLVAGDITKDGGDLGGISRALVSDPGDTAVWADAVEGKVLIEGRVELANSGGSWDVANIGAFATRADERITVIFASATSEADMKTALTDTIVQYELADASKYTTNYEGQNLVAFSGGQISRIPMHRNALISVSDDVTLDYACSRIKEVYEYVDGEESLVDPDDISLDATGLIVTITGASSGEVYYVVGFYDTSETTYPTQQIQYTTSNLATKVEALESYLQPSDEINYVTNGYTNGRVCETEHELYLAGKYILSTSLGSLDPESALKYLNVYITISAVEYLGVLTHEWNSGAPRLKFVYSGGTAYFDKDDATAVSTGIKVYKGALRKLEDEKDLRYDLPQSLVALYDAGDKRNSIRYTAISAIANLVLGDNTIADPTFDSASAWAATKGGDATITGGECVFNGSGSYVYVTGLTIGKIYKAKVLMNRWTSGAAISFGSTPTGSGTVYGNISQTPGDITEVYFQAVSSIIGLGSRSFSIDAAVDDFYLEKVLSGDITGTGYIEEAHDIEGTNDLVQAVEASQPELSSGYILTDGSNDRLVSEANVSIIDSFSFGFKSKDVAVGRVQIGESGGRSLFQGGQLAADVGAGIEALYSWGTTAEDRCIVTCDSGVVKFYLNGTEVVIVQPSSLLSLVTPNIYIGFSYLFYSVTKLKTFSVFNTALTPSEVSQLDSLLEAE